MGFNWSNKGTFSSRNNKQPKLADSVDVVEFPDGEYGAYRFGGEPKLRAVHWISTLGKRKDGKGKKKNTFPKLCLGFDPETGEVNAEKCPYCTVLEIVPRIEAWQNVIDREAQENEPRNAKPPTKKEQKLVSIHGGKYRVKEGKGKGGWTPWKVLTVIPAIGNPLGEIAGLNKHKVKGEKVECGPDHTRYGFDVMIKYDEKAPPKDKYKVQKGDIKPLTEEELAFPLWAFPDEEVEKEKDALKEAKRVKPFLCNYEGELIFGADSDEDEDDGKKKKKKNQYKDNFDEDEDLEGDDDEDEDEDEDEDDDRSSKKSKSKTKAKSKKSSDWDDDEDEDDDDDDVPFDGGKRVKSSKTKTGSSKLKSSKVKLGSKTSKLKTKSKTRRNAKTPAPRIKLKKRFPREFAA